MKRRSEIIAMQSRVERELEGEQKMLLLMALEWILNQIPSTSLGLEDWLEEQQ